MSDALRKEILAFARSHTLPETVRFLVKKGIATNPTAVRIARQEYRIWQKMRANDLDPNPAEVTEMREWLHKGRITSDSKKRRARRRKGVPIPPLRKKQGGGQ